MGVVLEFDTQFDQEDLVATTKRTNDGEHLQKQVTTTADVAFRSALILVRELFHPSTAL